MASSLNDEIDSLRARVAHHAWLYHHLDAPEITDFEYDQLLVRLRQLEKENPDLADDNSPTRWIGSEGLEMFKPVIHEVPMMSLDNVFSIEELRAYFLRVNKNVLQSSNEPIRWVFELKIDGLAVTLIYRHGHLVTAATRGNGRVGEDVTANILTIGEIPRTLNSSMGQIVPDLLEVRGEIYMNKDAFKRLNEAQLKAGAPLFANPRNCAAGSLRQKDPKLTQKRELSFWSYQLARIVGPDNPATHMESLNYLKNFGFPVNPNTKLMSSEVEVLDEITALDARRHHLGYEIDGAVIKIDDFSMRLALGSTARAPRWAIAFKLAPEERETKLVNIEVSIGKSGKATPFAVLEPVLVAGSMVSRATLHNQDQVQIKDIRIGDTVVVRKAGDVIPEVIRPIIEMRPKDAHPWQFPSVCPLCHSHLERIQGESDIYCSNPYCEGRTIQRISHFCSRIALDIEGFGESRVALFVDLKLIAEPPDIYRLSYDDLINLPSFGEKSVTSLIEAIELSKSRSLSRLLVGLSIRHVGETAARALAKRFGSLEALMRANNAEIENIDGIGVKIANSVIEFFRDPHTANICNELLELGVATTEPQNEAAAASMMTLSGKIVVITGTLSGFTRESAQEAVVSRGGKSASSVSSKTYALVVGDSPGASKVTKAEAAGVPIIDEEQFLRVLESGELP